MEDAADAGTWDTVKPALRQSVVNALESNGFNGMTPVQAACIPLLLSHKDVAAQAVTGSGKTLAFVVPLWEIAMRVEDEWRKEQEDEEGDVDMHTAIAHKHDVLSLIITPTRELATQVNGGLSLCGVSMCVCVVQCFFNETHLCAAIE